MGFFISSLVSTPAALADPATAAELNGTAQLFFGPTTCSGFVVDVGRPDSAKAIVASNGHCAGPQTPGPTQIFQDIPFQGWLGLHGTQLETGTAVRLGIRLVYSVMQETDLTLLEIPLTYGDLRAKGIRIFTLGASPAVGAPITATSGAWVETLRASVLENPLTLIEEGSTYHGALSFSNASGEVRGGWSGSPVLDEQGNVVAIVNSVCSMGSPCQVDRNGRVSIRVSVSAGRAYAQQLTGIRGCFAADGAFDLQSSSCPLPK